MEQQRPNLSGKLKRGSLRYGEAVELADDSETADDWNAKPKTQHANFTACPKDRRYFLSANKGGIYDANNRKTETGEHAI